MSLPTLPDYERHYSSEKLTMKLKDLSGRALRLIVLKACLLYELLKAKETPYAVRLSIIAVLGYLICPIDAIPDPLPGGFVDDIALMMGILASLNNLISREIKQCAEERAEQFGHSSGDLP